MHGPPFHGNRDTIRHFFQILSDRPCSWLLPLPCIRIKHLAEVPLSVQEGYGHHGDVEISCGTERVTSENTQAAAVCTDVLVKADLHAEICNGALVLCRFAGNHRDVSCLRSMLCTGPFRHLVGSGRHDKIISVQPSLWDHLQTLVLVLMLVSS
jgi:hypothetical protein